MSSRQTPSTVIRALDSRLSHLFEWAHKIDTYTDIWDLCCDHGRLGLHLHQSPTLKHCKIHLIDNVPSIINTLHSRYQTLIDHRLSIECMDASTLALPSNGRYLIVIAGVGGDTISSIIQGITEQLETIQPKPECFHLEYLLSPNLHTFELRHYLRAHTFELLEEAFVSENGQHHEHMHLRYHPRLGSYDKSSLAGEQLWHPFTRDKQHYLERYLKHYKKCLKWHDSPSAQLAVKTYSKILALHTPPTNI